jgi:hypothetical protein
LFTLKDENGAITMVRVFKISIKSTNMCQKAKFLR